MSLEPRAPCDNRTSRGFWLMAEGSWLKAERWMIPSAKGLEYLEVPLRARAPREVAFHRGLDEAAPRFRIAPRGEGALHRLRESLGRRRIEHETRRRPLLHVRGSRVDDRVGEPPGPADHRDRAVPQAVDLIQPAWLVAR